MVHDQTYPGIKNVGGAKTGGHRSIQPPKKTQ